MIPPSSRNSRPGLLWVSLCLFTAISAGVAKPNLDAIVREIDVLRHPTEAFTITLEVREQKRGEAATEGEFRLSARSLSEGRYSSLLECLAPADDRGKKILTVGGKVWFYDPKAERPVRMTARQLRDRYFLAEGLFPTFGRSFEPRYVGSEIIPDVRGRDVECEVVELINREPGGNSPARIRYWMAAGNRRPVRGIFYAESGAMMRTAYYSNFRNVLGHPRPTVIYVIEAADGTLTTLKFRSFKKEKFPPGTFDPANLAD